MAFPESIKKEARRKSHYCCVVCKQPFVEVHHIIPQAEGGDDTLDNAAPLCGSCHDLLGGNPDKRKQIKEMRDLWWEICEKREANPGWIALNQEISDLREDLQAQGLTQDQRFDEIKSLIHQYFEDTADAISESGSFDELIAATSTPFREMTRCPSCKGNLAPVGPKVHPQLGMVMYYQCMDCKLLYPGSEELEG